MASIEENILSTLKEILTEVREIRRISQKPQESISNLLTEDIQKHAQAQIQKMKHIKETFSKFPGEDNGTD